jgi:hypothetical protein
MTKSESKSGAEILASVIETIRGGADDDAPPASPVFFFSLLSRSSISSTVFRR